MQKNGNLSAAIGSTDKTAVFENLSNNNNSNYLESKYLVSRREKLHNIETHSNSIGTNWLNRIDRWSMTNDWNHEHISIFAFLFCRLQFYCKLFGRGQTTNGINMLNWIVAIHFYCSGECSPQCSILVGQIINCKCNMLTHFTTFSNTPFDRNPWKNRRQIYVALASINCVDCFVSFTTCDVRVCASVAFSRSKFDHIQSTHVLISMHVMSPGRMSNQ